VVQYSPDYPTFTYPALFYLMCHVGPEKADRLSHSEGFNFIKAARAYVEYQREVTTVAELLFRYWCDLAAEKSKGVQKQIPITNFLKK
jgi:hypothetical protein